jgi:hypothetical protein
MSATFSSGGVLRVVAGALASATLTLLIGSVPGSAQMAADRRVQLAGDLVLTVIRDSSCADLMAKMQKSRGGGGGGSSMMQQKMAALLADPRNRTAFANRIGGPLVNKMLDCKMMPFGH